MYSLSLVSLAYLLSESSGTLAPFIIPCKSNGTECLIASTQNAIPHLGKGIPELGVLPSDSLTFKEINADQGELKLTFRDTKLVGTSKCQVINVKRDIEKSTIFIEIVPLYKLDGKLLFIPAQGDGEYEIKIAKPVIDILNNSCKILLTEIGAPIIKELIAKSVDSIKKFILSVPTTELELS